jgi:divalent metal cation (Fe/Co/Zn/Cd) transporter
MKINSIVLERMRPSFNGSPIPQFTEFLAKVKGLALSVPGVLGVHDLRAEYIGPDTVHAGMHIEVQRGLPIEKANSIAEEVLQRLHDDADSGYCVIHVDPSPSEQEMPMIE